MEKKEYPMIDYFRMIAAFLVITIHTSPLLTFNETADFILTRIIGRVAVPFFFMTSGFFLINGNGRNKKRLTVFCKKTAMLYLVAILCYLPVNIYNGYFRMQYLLPNILRDIVFDGTMYHLWYLPATLLGGIIAYQLVSRLQYKKSFIIAIVLYVIGLFGDSYYGLISGVPIINSFYSNLFELFSYTRNGLFFAPVFFVLGAWIHEKVAKEEVLHMKTCLIGVFVSFLLMLTEGLLLHSFQLQRHDSMYLFLLPCMYFLFMYLIQYSGEKNQFARNISYIIYIAHPFVILVVRIIGKGLGLSKYLIDNSLIHFLAVFIITLLFSVTFLMLKNKFYIPKKVHKDVADRSWIEIDMEALRHNTRELKKIMPKKCDIMAVVKAEGYGHGAVAVSEELNKAGVKAFAVATFEEGIRLRKRGIEGDILILGFTEPSRLKLVIKYQLTQTIYSLDYANLLNKMNLPIKVHVKVDTGMHRLGVSSDNLDDFIKIFKMRNLKIEGIYTHLCTAESMYEEDKNYAIWQINKFYDVIDSIKKAGCHIPKMHIQSSYGLLNYPELNCDYARLGIALYGAIGKETRLHVNLHPVLTLKSKIILIHQIKAGETVGYGRDFLAKKDSTLAVIPIGYADGYPRNLSGGKGMVLVAGQKVPIVGKICMDHITADITDIEGVKLLDTVVLIGRQGNSEIKVTTVANQSESIPNEILSRMGRRLKLINQSN